MKKRNLKSLQLNKKTISTLETTEVKGGSVTGCTYTAYTPIVPIAVDAAIDAITDFFD